MKELFYDLCFIFVAILVREFVSQVHSMQGNPQTANAMYTLQVSHYIPADSCCFLQMPGLCVYNDAHFTEEDWSGIRKLHDSVKVKDPLKVGRFGLGFKSVFHLTGQ